MPEPTATPPLAALDPALVRALELAEAIAYNREAFAAAAALDGDPAGARWADIGGGVAAALTSLDSGFFNRVVGLGVARPATEADVAAVLDFYTGLDRSESVVQVAPTARPPELVGWLEAAGYRSSPERTVTLWHELDALPDARASMRVERIGPERAHDFARVHATASGLPAVVAPLAEGIVGRDGWTCYLGFDGNEPVTTAALFVEGTWAWLGFGATLESHRGRGGQSATLAIRLRDAKDARVRWAITETGAETPEAPANHSYRNMLRAGFHLAYERRNHVRDTGS